MLLEKHVKRQESEITLADRRTARVCAVIANANRKKEAKPFTEDDFMPEYKAAEPKTQTVEEQKAILMAAAGKVG